MARHFDAGHGGQEWIAPYAGFYEITEDEADRIVERIRRTVAGQQ